jgi:hypothetical protein
MREDALDDLLRPALVAQDRRAFLRVLVERRCISLVEVVQQRSSLAQSCSSSPNRIA